LLVQFSFIRTRHPFPIVLMDGNTANVIGSRLSLGLSGVKAFAMGKRWAAPYKDCHQSDRN